jgi:hypothetical protein
MLAPQTGRRIDRMESDCCSLYLGARPQGLTARRRRAGRPHHLRAVAALQSRHDHHLPTSECAASRMMRRASGRVR